MKKLVSVVSPHSSYGKRNRVSTIEIFFFRESYPWIRRWKYKVATLLYWLRRLKISSQSNFRLNPRWLQISKGYLSTFNKFVYFPLRMTCQISLDIISFFSSDQVLNFYDFINLFLCFKSNRPLPPCTYAKAWPA